MRDEARALIGQARSHRLRGEDDSAAAALDRADLLVAELRGPREAGYAARERALLELEDGDLDRARIILEQTTERARQRGDIRQERMMLVLSADLHARAGALESARALAGRALVGPEALPVDLDLARSLDHLGHRLAEGLLLEEARHALELARRQYWLMERLDREATVSSRLAGLPQGRGRS
jgi:tetratricopeptide (TPR) repeat protein